MHPSFLHRPLHSCTPPCLPLASCLRLLLNRSYDNPAIRPVYPPLSSFFALRLPTTTANAPVHSSSLCLLYSSLSLRHDTRVRFPRGRNGSPSDVSRLPCPVQGRPSFFNGPACDQTLSERMPPFVLTNFNVRSASTGWRINWGNGIEIVRRLSGTIVPRTLDAGGKRMVATDC